MAQRRHLVCAGATAATSLALCGGLAFSSGPHLGVVPQQTVPVAPRDARLTRRPAAISPTLVGNARTIWPFATAAGCAAVSALAAMVNHKKTKNGAKSFVGSEGEGKKKAPVAKTKDEAQDKEFKHFQAKGFAAESPPSSAAEASSTPEAAGDKGVDKEVPKATGTEKTYEETGTHERPDDDESLAGMKTFVGEKRWEVETAKPQDKARDDSEGTEDKDEVEMFVGEDGAQVEVAKAKGEEPGSNESNLGGVPYPIENEEAASFSEHFVQSEFARGEEQNDMTKKLDEATVFCNHLRRCLTEYEVKQEVLQQELAVAKADALALESQNIQFVELAQRLEEDLAGANSAKDTALEAAQRYSEDAEKARRLTKDLEAELLTARACARAAELRDARGSNEIELVRAESIFRQEFIVEETERLLSEIARLKARLVQVEAEADREREDLLNKVRSARAAAEAVVLKQDPPSPFGLHSNGRRPSPRDGLPRAPPLTGTGGPDSGIAFEHSWRLQ